MAQFWLVDFYVFPPISLMGLESNRKVRLLLAARPLSLAAIRYSGCWGCQTTVVEDSIRSTAGQTLLQIVTCDISLLVPMRSATWKNWTPMFTVWQTYWANSDFIFKSSRFCLCICTCTIELKSTAERKLKTIGLVLDNIFVSVHP